MEVPHALAVVLALAGGADIALASLEDMVTEQGRLPLLGRARLALAHHRGVRTEIDSDLTSPVRERRIRLEFDEAVLTGHYPCSAADHTAQLRVEAAGREPTRSVFTDDALPEFIRAAYARYAERAPDPGALPVQVEAVRLLAEAKRLCASGARREEVGSAPELETARPPLAGIGDEAAPAWPPSSPRSPNWAGTGWSCAPWTACRSPR
ncbi:hypothetical protein ACFQXA_01635 [Nocardiopsis composta]